MIVKLFSFLLCCLGVLVGSMPFLVHEIFGYWQPLALVFMPFVDETTFVGFWILYVYHIFTDLLCVFGFISADLVCGIIILHYIPMILVFEQHVQSFNTIITRNSKYGESKKAFEYFGNIVMLHKELLRSVSVILKYIFFYLYFSIISAL